MIKMILQNFNVFKTLKDTVLILSKFLATILNNNAIFCYLYQQLDIIMLLNVLQ